MHTVWFRTRWNNVSKNIHQNISDVEWGAIKKNSVSSSPMRVLETWSVMFRDLVRDSIVEILHDY